MDDLLNRRIKSSKPTKKKKGKQTVEYTLDGHAIKGKLSALKKTLLIIVISITFLFMFIYIPPMFYDGEVSSSYLPITPNAAAIKGYQTYLKDHPDEDFDRDGLSNAMENEHGTDIWYMDSDYDGVSDYAELFLTETSPTKTSTVLMEQMMEQDERNGDTLGTPYKIDDIIFWPDTYHSKSYGAVVRTLNGYRFCNYEGWVRFPEKVYAYTYDGTHHEMQYRELENAWRIETEDEILLYQEPLTFVHRLELPFIKDIFLEDNVITSFLSNVLPSKGGLVRCNKISTIDAVNETIEEVSAPLNLPYFDEQDYSRLSVDQTSLKNLSKVRQLIDMGECVAVSFYSGNTGEAIGVIYGYDQKGDFLVADTSLTPAGKIYIDEYAMRMMDKDGEIGQLSWFEWSGIGFSSYNGDRISFFASTVTGVKEDSNEVAIAQEAHTESLPIETELITTTFPELETTEEQTGTEAITETAITEEWLADGSPQETEDVQSTKMTPVTEMELLSEKSSVTETTTTTVEEPVTEKQDSIITFGF